MLIKYRTLRSIRGWAAVFIAAVLAPLALAAVPPHVATFPLPAGIHGRFDASGLMPPWRIVSGTVARLWEGTTRLPEAAVRDWRLTVPLVLATGALVLFADAPIAQRIQAPGLERASNNWSNRGLLEIEPAFALTAAAIENRCLFCRSTGKFALTAITAEGYATASVQALKYAAGRERPYTPHDGDGGFSEGGTSFPSGHTIGVFTLAALLAQHDPQAHWINGAAYLLAGGVGAARVTAKDHFPSDVVVGATLGILLGRCAAKCPAH